MRLFLLLLSLSVGSGASAELTLKISGNSESLTGDLVVLKSDSGDDVTIDWIWPDSLQGKTAVLGDQLIFATRDAGEYTIILYGTDGATLDNVKHKVVVTNPDVKPPPVDPVDPDPKPGFSGLEKLSRDLSTRLGDEKTRARLALRIMGASFTGSPAEVDSSIQQTIFKVFAERSRDEQDADWLNGWYRPVTDELNRLVDQGKIVSITDLKSAMKSVATGLTNGGT